MNKLKLSLAVLAFLGAGCGSDFKTGEPVPQTTCQAHPAWPGCPDYVPPPPPVIDYFTVTPTTLPPLGGTVSWSFKTENEPGQVFVGDQSISGELQYEATGQYAVAENSTSFTLYGPGYFPQTIIVTLGTQ